MAEKLTYKFFHAKDLDEALHYANELASKRDQYQQILAELTEVVNSEWSTNRQGVYNLLQNILLIPPDMRFSTLEKALRSEDPAFVLSGCIGCQEIATFGDQENKFKQELFKIIKETQYR